MQRRTIGDSVACVVKKLEASVSVLDTVGKKFAEGFSGDEKAENCRSFRSDEDFGNC